MTDRPHRQDIARGWLALPQGMASLAALGCPGQSTPAAPHLEHVLRAFVTGYNTARWHGLPALADAPLRHCVSRDFEGFAFEGAGFWYALQDCLCLWRPSSLAQLTESVAPEHDFIAMVGAGFAVARLPMGHRWLPRFQARFDPLTAWCVADGFGFHAGIFHWRRHAAGSEAPRAFSDQHRQLFDAGVGRSFWWVYGADVTGVSRAIARQAPYRRGAMWEGIGTALAYAGGVGEAVMTQLHDAASEHRADLRVGVALAGHMRRRGGNPADWTALACRTVLKNSVVGASDLVGRILSDVLAAPDMADTLTRRTVCYLRLRARLRSELSDG